MTCECVGGRGAAAANAGSGRLCTDLPAPPAYAPHHSSIALCCRRRCTPLCRYDTLSQDRKDLVDKYQALHPGINKLDADFKHAVKSLGGEWREQGELDWCGVGFAGMTHTLVLAVLLVLLPGRAARPAAMHACLLMMPPLGANPAWRRRCCCSSPPSPSRCNTATPPCPSLPKPTLPLPAPPPLGAGS